MVLRILIGGKAGEGVARISYIIGKIFTNFGYYVFNYRDYQSLIKGGHNFNILRISSNNVSSHEEENIDIMIALDENTINLHQNKMRDGGIVICDESISKIVPKNLIVVGINTSEILKKYGAPPIAKNTVLLGVLLKILSIKPREVSGVIKKNLKNPELQIKLLNDSFNTVQKNIIKIKRVGRKKYFISGTEAIGLGAIYAGLDVYIAYPMTPATPLLHFLAKRQSKHKILVLQLENEIAVINAALGASYAGAISMIGTSGGGFDLMSEALSLQGISEIPLVVYLAQRVGPGTGVPTYTEQADLNIALYSGHGEFPRIVVAPGDANDALLRTVEAFYLSQKYRLLSVILGDKHLGESNFSYDKIKLPRIKIRKKFAKGDKKKLFSYYRITVDGVSPRAVPGETLVKANSYEHDELGITTEDKDVTSAMKEKRNRKMQNLVFEINKFEPVKVFGEGNNLIISWGSTKGAILDALDKLNDFKFAQIVYLSPFPKEIVKNLVETSSKVFLIENNSTGQLGSLIKKEVGFDVENVILKYDGRPFTPNYVIKKISEKL